MRAYYRLPIVSMLILSMFAPRLGAGETGPERPRLVVLLVFDQLRGDYPERWQAQFGEGGFKRLAKEGTWFTNCHYPYSNTITAAGHASIATGTSPNKHGLVGNSWYDRASKRAVNSVNFDKYRQLPPPLEIPKDVKLGVSPEYRLQPSIADMLQEATKSKGKIVSLSIKDRAAALMAAFFGQLVYWFSDLTGGFVTSTRYRDTPHEWVDRFNQEEIPAGYFGTNWKRFRTDLDYDKFAGPDDMAGEAKSLGLGKTFPHPITGGLKKPGEAFYEAVVASPLGNDLLVRFAKRAIDEEKLGQDDVPDLLMISFSSNDIVGHIFGPDSHEVLDITLRTDALIADLLKHLDRKVGKGRYGVVLSADHGICPLPEVALSRGKDAGRIAPAVLKKDAEAFLQATIGASERPYIESLSPPWFYLDRKTLALLKVEQADVEQKLADWLVKAYGAKGVQAAFTSTALAKGRPKDKLGEQVWLSHFAPRCGDVTVVMKPYYFISSYITGTTHGSPHGYDTHVPLYVLGPGIPGGRSDERVTPQAAAPILAQLLGVPAPSGADVGVPTTLRRK